MIGGYENHNPDKGRMYVKRIIVSALLMLAGIQYAAAQDRAEIKNDIKTTRESLLKERQNQAKPTGQAVTAADVGEPDSFGKNVLFLGIAQSGAVLIDPACDPVDLQLGPDDHCITVADPTVAVPSTQINDIARITIPGKSVNNIVFAIANHTLSFDMFNPGATPVQGRISYVPSVTIESDALNDPSLINPATGQPFNGSFTTSGLGTYSANQTLASGASNFLTHSYSPANTLGFSRTFFAGLGLPNNVIDQLYKKPMTIRLNVRISSRYVDSAVILFTARFFGN